MSSRYVKSLFIMAKFITKDDGIDCYPDQVQYFFKHTINLLMMDLKNIFWHNLLDDGPKEHFLAYIRWYKHASSRSIRYHFSSDNDYNTCNVELWSTEFYQESRDCIILVHHILNRFILVNYQVSDQRNSREYLAVNQINRKYHIR